MILRSALAAISLLPALISGDQVPAVNQSERLSTDPTPGKLRVVENSGVCGAVILFTTYLTTYSLLY